MNYPSNPAGTQLPILDSIKERWSPLAFSDRPVEQEKIDTFFEAARWAPSSYNEQPWFFVYATKDDVADRRKMESLLAEGNAWAKNAYILLIPFAKQTFARNGKPNRHAVYDTGCATGYLFLQLSSLGLIGHEMAGFDWKGANKAFGVASEYEAIAMMAIGYPGDPTLLSDDLGARETAPRERKPMTDFVSRGSLSS